MKVRLLKDVSIPQGGVGTIGQVVEMPDATARKYIERGKAEEAKEGDKPAKPGEDRDKKPAKGPAETK